MPYAYLTVRVPLMDHSFVATAEAARALLLNVFRRDTRCLGCDVVIDKGHLDKDEFMLDVEAWNASKPETRNIFDDHKE